MDAGWVAEGGKVAIVRPTADQREPGQINGIAGLDDLLAEPGSAAFGADLEEGGELFGLVESLGK